jgi:hypothetical protein
MKHYENNLNQWPLTGSGFNSESCSRAIQPENNRKPVMLAVKGQRWLRAHSGRNFNAFEKGTAKTPSGGSLNCKIKTIVEDSDVKSLYAELMPFEFHDCFDAAKLRKRTLWHGISPEKAKATAFEADISIHKPYIALEAINHGKIIKLSCSALNRHFNPVAQTKRDFKLACKTSLRWRKIMLLDWFIKLLSVLKYPGKSGVELFKIDLQLNLN